MTIKNELINKGRVISRNRDQYIILTNQCNVRAILSGKFQHEHALAEYPVVGDYVLFDRADGDVHRIYDVLPRFSKFSRKEAGVVTNEQVLATNIDVVFVVTGLDDNFNIARMMRYRAVVIEGGAKPVFILNKRDLCNDLEEKMSQLKKVISDENIHAISTYTGEGLESLEQYLDEEVTVALFGSSGVGKSSITNTLLGDSAMVVGAVSEAHGKGKHTTTTAELKRMACGGFLIDTPGMRELQIWCDEESVDESFDDINTLASQCKFEDCQHKNEPGCMVQQSIREGRLQEKHLKNYLNLKREAKHIKEKQKEKDRLNNRISQKSRPRDKRVHLNQD